MISTASPLSSAEKLVPLRTMLLYSAGNAGYNAVASFTNFALPLFLLPYGLPAWIVGFLAQERSGVGGLIQPLIGMLSDRTHTPLGRRRPYFLVGVPLTAIGLLFLATRPPIVPLLVVVSILALLLAIANDPYLALMADMTPAQQRGRIGSFMGLFSMASQVGVLLMASQLWGPGESTGCGSGGSSEASLPPVAPLTEGQVLVICGVVAIMLVCYAITFFGVKEPVVGFYTPSRARPGRHLGAYVRDVLGYREVVKYSVAMTFFWLGGGAAAPFLTRFGVCELGLEQGASFLLVMGLVLCTALAAYPAGHLGDRFGKKRVQLVGLAFFSVAILAASQARSMEQILVAVFFVGVGNAIPYVLAFPLLADLMPRDRAGEFTGLGSVLWSLVGPLGAMLGGVLVGISGGYRLGFIFSGVMMICSFLALLSVRAPAKASPEPAPRATQLVA